MLNPRLANPLNRSFETYVCSFFSESQNSIAVNWVFNYLLVFKRFLVKECIYISAIRVKIWTEITPELYVL